ncbi:hypothetical protein GGE06_005250 [Streptomyces sp. SFB5A]|uniref:Heavy metal translocating P-type ATPase n=1 Tax=Streptomyces nymphaeiformis TaxID=2663842 RepID=A0A7W7XD35_9ACTN|nr:hypothetical protein [Streptomyces nymphaeiformis]
MNPTAAGSRRITAAITSLRLESVLLSVTAAALAGSGIAWLVGAPGLSDLFWALGTVAAVVPAVVWVLAALRRGQAGVDLIAVLALGGTLAVGEYLAGALIALMLATGRTLEAAARADQDPGHTRTSRLQPGRIVAVSAGQWPCEACTTSTRKTCWSATRRRSSASSERVRRDAPGAYLSDGPVRSTHAEHCLRFCLHLSQPTLLPIVPGGPEHRSHSLVRAGTTPLFATVEVARRKVIGRPTDASISLRVIAVAGREAGSETTSAAAVEPTLMGAAAQTVPSTHSWCSTRGHPGGDPRGGAQGRRGRAGCAGSAG